MLNLLAAKAAIKSFLAGGGEAPKKIFEPFGLGCKDGLYQRRCRFAADSLPSVTAYRSAEVQVADEGDYEERSLYYWAREYSSAITDGQDYRDLPKTIVISIMSYNLFADEEYHTVFQPLEVSRHEPLTDKMELHYYELRKLPQLAGANDALLLWLSLLKAETDEDLRQIQALGAPIMEQAISVYKQLTAEDRFKELERLRSFARHNEAAALRHARDEAKIEEREKCQSELAEKDAEIARLRGIIAEQGKAP